MEGSNIIGPNHPQIGIRSMRTTLKVFLCGTSSDLSEERESVLDAIRHLGLLHRSMEFFGARTDQPIESCFAEVRESDVLVVIVSLRYGNLVPGLGVSFSEAEYDEGYRLQKPCLVYIRNENVPILLKHIEQDPNKMALLQAWKRRLYERHTIAVFDSPERLSVKVAADLSRVVRELEERETKSGATTHHEHISDAITNAESVRTTMNVLEATYDSSPESLRRALLELERSYDLTVEVFAGLVDLTDAETEGHNKRVTAYTIAMARAMNLPDEQVRMIGRGALLHDIGKVAIPDAILRKPGRLTPEEQMVLREHPLLGYQMFRKIPFLQPAAEIVYSHQEHYDGSGYPRGLKGEEIPLGARIFAIADSFDAITSDRPYRRAQSISTARREIERHSGTLFDPDVVNVFLGLPERIWTELKNEVAARKA